MARQEHGTEGAHPLISRGDIAWRSKHVEAKGTPPHTPMQFIVGEPYMEPQELMYGRAAARYRCDPGMEPNGANPR